MPDCLKTEGVFETATVHRSRPAANADALYCGFVSRAHDGGLAAATGGWASIATE